jgi:penicillin-binding protein 2
VATRGTASEAFAGFPFSRLTVAAKTGTAEVRGRADFALFAGFAPVSEARYAFAVVIEEAGFGGDAAAPVARRFLEAALDVDGPGPVEG